MINSQTFLTFSSVINSLINERLSMKTDNSERALKIENNKFNCKKQQQQQFDYYVCFDHEVLSRIVKSLQLLVEFYNKTFFKIRNILRSFNINFYAETSFVNLKNIIICYLQKINNETKYIKTCRFFYTN